MPWGLTFARQGADSGPRHPTQLYEALVLLAIAAALHRFYQANTRPGLAMVGLGYLYGTERFLIEFVRDESTYEHYVMGLTLAHTRPTSTPAEIHGAIRSATTDSRRGR
jgi:prolipoprotein diacylglyceryltransferase